MINGFDAKTTCGGSGIKVDNSKVKLVKGDRGEAGYTPYIGSNGNWWINGEDTGYKAKGDKGDKGDDYTITAADYQAIADRVPQPDLSEYVKNTDYATSSKGGVVKVGSYSTDVLDGKLASKVLTNAEYDASGTRTFVSKGTLENVLNERLKEPQFELIEEITLTEEMTNLNRTAEPNGTPYNFKRLFMYFSNSTVPTKTINVIPYVNNKIVGDNFIVSLNAVNSHASIDLVINNGLLKSTNVSASFGNGNSANPKVGICRMENALINQINSFSLSGYDPIPSGTNIKIYAVRG